MVSFPSSFVLWDTKSSPETHVPFFPGSLMESPMSSGNLVPRSHILSIIWLCLSKCVLVLDLNKKVSPPWSRLYSSDSLENSQSDKNICPSCQWIFEFLSTLWIILALTPMSHEDKAGLVPDTFVTVSPPTRCFWRSEGSWWDRMLVTRNSSQAVGFH